MSEEKIWCESVAVIMPAPVDIISYASVHDKVVQDLAKQEDSSAKQGIVGLANLGNTCYLNTALQCLASTNPLTEYFLGFPWRDELNRDNPIGAGGKIAEEFGQLISDMWEVNDNSKHKIISPNSFKKTLGRFQPQFQGTQQQDVQELLAFLLDGLHEDLNRVINKPYVEDAESDGKLDKQDELAVDSWRRYLLRNRSIVVDIFQGQLRNVLTCLSCKYISLKFDPYMYMSVPCNSETTTLSQCLAEFCKPEILSTDCQWHCPKCQKPRDAEKKLDIWIAPPIFIVHLKRFMQNSKGKRSKIDSFIDFPIRNLDLSNFLGKKGRSRHLYNLYGVANHHGSLARGHYTAFARNARTNKWYKYNDSRINEIKDEDVVTKSAYVLFYSKVCLTEGTESDTTYDKCEVEYDLNSPDGASEIVNPSMKMLTVDMIRRQSITIPHHWPHNVSSSNSSSLPFASNPLESFEEGNEDLDDEFDKLPCPSFFSEPCTVNGIDNAVSEGTSDESVSDSQYKSASRVKLNTALKPKRKYSKREFPVCENYVDRRARRRAAPDRFS